VELGRYTIARAVRSIRGMALIKRRNLCAEILFTDICSSACTFGAHGAEGSRVNQFFFGSPLLLYKCYQNSFTTFENILWTDRKTKTLAYLFSPVEEE